MKKISHNNACCYVMICHDHASCCCLSRSWSSCCCCYAPVKFFLVQQFKLVYRSVSQWGTTVSPGCRVVAGQSITTATVNFLFYSTEPPECYKFLLLETTMTMSHGINLILKTSLKKNNFFLFLFSFPIYFFIRLLHLLTGYFLFFSSIGMAKSALEAINGCNLFGEKGASWSVIYVDIDAHNRNRSIFETLLPRESSSKVLWMTQTAV